MEELDLGSWIGGVSLEGLGDGPEVPVAHEGLEEHESENADHGGDEHRVRVVVCKVKVRAYGIVLIYNMASY